MGIKGLYELYKKHYKVVKDTREELSNAIYFSLKGANFNGNQYALEALKKGASYAVIDEKEYLEDERMILVEDALTTLQELARYHRKQLNIKILALTGSNGKTTTKELISAVLNKKYNCYATRGNLNNHIGVPLTLLAMTPLHDFGIVEMGANHQHEIEALCEIALPDFGYITNFGRVHLEGFGSYEGVIQGKTEMYRHLKRNGKKVFVYKKDPIQMEKSAGTDRIVFGGPGSAYEVTLEGADPFVNISFEGTGMQSRLIGTYNYSNIVTAVCIGKYFGVKTGDSKMAIEGYLPENNRSQLIQLGSNKIIMDAYNANPNSMDAAIENLETLSDKKKVAILGDMFEIGDDSIKEHQKIAERIMALNRCRTYLIGHSFYKTSVDETKVSKYASFNEFAKEFKKESFDNTTFLVKGSRGMALEKVLDCF